MCEGVEQLQGTGWNNVYGRRRGVSLWDSCNLHVRCTLSTCHGPVTPIVMQQLLGGGELDPLTFPSTMRPLRAHRAPSNLTSSALLNRLSPTRPTGFRFCYFVALR